eukprot:Gb_25400 [translate_table: standard]
MNSHSIFSIEVFKNEFCTSPLRSYSGYENHKNKNTENIPYSSKRSKK